MNARLRRLLAIFVGLPICLAIGVSIVILIFHLPEPFKVPGICALIVITLISLIMLGTRSKQHEKKIGELLDILYKEVDPDKFISASEAELKKSKNRSFRQTLSLNLAIGYDAAGRFDDAVRLTKEMDITAADKTSKVMYYYNAAMFYADKGAVPEALEAYQMAKPFLNKADIPASYSLFIRGLMYYLEKEYDEALSSFESARKKGFDDRHTLTKLQLFEARTFSALGREKDARATYAKVLQRKTYPYILDTARKEAAALA